jgi:PAS domain S-box-containing protein
MLILGKLYDVQYFLSAIPAGAFGISPQEPMRLAASGLCLTVALMTLTWHDSFGIWKLLREASPGSYVARRLLPAIVLVLGILGYLRLQGELYGWYDSRMGLVLYATSSIVVISSLALFFAQSLNSAEHLRRQTMSDLTEEKHASEAVLEAMPQMVWTCTADGTCDFLNQRWMEYTGQRLETQLGFGWTSAVHPEDLDRIRSLWAISCREGSTMRAEYRLRHSSGRYRWFEALASPVRDTQGRIRKWFGCSVDIHELRALNEQLESRVSERTAALAQVQARLQSVIDASTQVAIVVTDASGTIEIFNSGAERMLGYRAEELVGKASASILHLPQELADRVAEGRRALGDQLSEIEASTYKLRLGQPDVGEWHYICKDGRLVDVQLAVTAIPATTFLNGPNDPNAGFAGYLGIAVDITERKELERNLDHANRAKSDFLASMSHEIRTPMNGVIGMTGLLLDTDLSQEQRPFAETIRGSGEALLAIINDILDFSKIEAGKLDLENINFQPRAVIDDVAQLLALKAEEKGLEVTCLCHADVPDVVNGDPGRLRQIVLNLAANAIKFTSSGSVSIEMHTRESAPEYSLIEVRVRDTGIGIPADKLDRLFREFSQVDGSVTRRFGGTGLGLAISKRLAEKMGGEIGVESEPGRGSTFWFTVCLGAVDTRPSAALAERGSIEGARILVVDDNAANIQVLSNQLLAWGCLFECAATPADALGKLHAAALARRAFDVVLLDQRMPEMDGDELGRLIQNDPLCRGVAMVLMTSMSQKGQAKLCRDIGFSGYLVKPIRQAELRGCLELVLGQARSGSTSASTLVTRHVLNESQPRLGRILLAEDNTTNQLVAVAMGKRLGYRMDVVANGLEAVRAVQSASYDLILMDCHMPEMDGYDATRLIRALTDAKAATIPIIALTANAMPGDRERCLEAGMNDYVSKPLNREELASAIERWLAPRLAV